MGVKVVIERKFREPVVLKDIQIIEDIRIQALRQRGYIGGETMVNAEDFHEVVVLSAWSSVYDWTSWLENADRIKLENALTVHLAEPAKIRAFMTSADHLKKSSGEGRTQPSHHKQDPSGGCPGGQFPAGRPPGS